ncbi:two-component regulator propeller domain-containing protein [Lentimicrobium sp. S6]|uniref:two-component regulator propeller domain-containing protein n=1 Tax=Lentimicrobium sp. S6 TaxID=2735872 RepID=UPI0015565C87|nr:two-component regulator propeller domain-containing protein [Lentimicrobium sp. S6]NPD48109.1 histidine kinase [Lentimicrobium sp. S6]
MKFKTLLFIMLCLWGLNQAQTQVVELNEDFQTKFDKLSAKDGLSDNRILDIIQDRYGFIWIATTDGLNRYDGYEFLVFKNIPTDSTSISSNLITSITEDIYGDLWIGTSFGLNRYDRTKDVFIHYFSDKKNHNGLQNDHIRKLLADEKGVLWIETVDGHLHQFNVRTEQIKHYKHQGISQEYYHYHTMLKENDSILWIGGRGLNVHRFNVNTKEFDVINANEYGGGFQKRANDVSFYFIDSKDQFWVCGLDGAYKFDRENKQFELFMRGSTFCIYEDKNQTLWFGKGNGITKYNPNTNEFIHVSANVNNPNALSNDHVNKIMEDMSGVVWVATNGGLSLYSPKNHNFTHYFHIPGEERSVSGRKVTALAEDKDGILWVGTDSEGLNAFDFKKGVIGEYKKGKTKSSLLSSHISHLYFDSSENLWVSQWSGLGLDKLNIKTNEVQSYTINNASTYTDWYHQVLEDRKQNIVMAVWGGYGLYGIQKDKSEIDVLGADLVVIPNEKYISTISFEEDSVTWFGGINGQLDVTLKSKTEMIHLKNLFHNEKPSYPGLQKMQAYNYVNMKVPYFDTITKVLRADRQTYFANRKGLFAFDHQCLKFHKEFPKEMQNQSVLTMAKIDESVWFLLEHTLAVYNRRSGEWNYIEMNLNGGGQAQLLITLDRIWISRGKNLYQFNRSFQRIDSSRYSHRIVSLQEIEHDKIAFAVGSSIIIKGKSEGRIELTEKIQAFLWKPEGILWLSKHMLWQARLNDTGHTQNIMLISTVKPNTELSALVFHEMMQKDQYYYLLSNKGYLIYDEINKKTFYNRERELSFMRYPVHLLTAISKADDGEYWLGTTSTGIAKWDAESHSLKNYVSNEFIEDAYWGETVNFIFTDSKGRNWSGATGLNLYSDSLDGFTHYTKKDGLPSNNLRGMAEDNHGQLWISTEKGLSCFSIPEQSFTTYTPANGLPSMDLTSAIIQLQDGRMAFGTQDGFAVFHPDSLESNHYIPPVVITEFRVQDNQVFKDLSELDTVIIKPDENHISFRFASLDYNSPSDNKYQYKLEGVDDTWIQTNSINRAISYSNLDPGTYVFKLKGSNNNGIWNEHGKSITVLILPRFYQQWWFYALISLLFIFVIVMIVIYRIRELKLQNKAASLEQRFLRSQMNPHFIFNSLGAIQSFIFKNEPIEAATYLSNFSDLVRMILNNSRQDLITLHTEVKTLNQYLDLQKLRFGEKFDYEIEADENLDLEDMLIPPMLAQPFIENSIEHGFKGMKSKGLIQVGFRLIDNRIVLICQDNGIGINASIREKEQKNRKYKSLATKITKDRIAVLNKVYKSNIQLEISDLKDIGNYGRGTRVEIKIPMNLKME